MRIGTTHKPSKLVAAKKCFLQCVCYRCNSLQGMFFIPCGNWKTLFFIKFCRYFEISSSALLLLSLKQVFWKKIVFYVTSTITVQCLCQSSKIKLSYTILILDKLSWLICFILFYFILILFFFFFCTLLFFQCSTLVFINGFFWRNQTLSESVLRQLKFYK